MSMSVLNVVAGYAGDVCAVITLCSILIRPIRNKILGLDAIRDGAQCLLRSEILKIYYDNLESKELREYEFKNLEKCYKAYRALGGNSFVEHIYEEMMEWSIIP